MHCAVIAVNKNQCNLAEGGIAAAVASPLNFSFAFSRWQHGTDGLTAILNARFSYRRRLKRSSFWRPVTLTFDLLNLLWAHRLGYSYPVKRSHQFRFFCRWSKQWRIKSRRPPLLTGCILKQVNILHKNALFLHKILKTFPEPFFQTPPLPFCIRHWLRITYGSDKRTDGETSGQDA